MKRYAICRSGIIIELAALRRRWSPAPVTSRQNDVAHGPPRPLLDGDDRSTKRQRIVRSDCPAGRLAGCKFGGMPPVPTGIDTWCNCGSTSWLMNHTEFHARTFCVDRILTMIELTPSRPTPAFFGDRTVDAVDMNDRLTRRCAVAL